MTENVEVLKKICLIGPESVGKTSLIKRYILNIFDDKYLKTLGTKVSKKVITIERPEKDLNINVTMLVWDIMGQDIFRPLLQDAYFYGANGCLAVCDITRNETLKSLEQWVESLHTTVGKVPLIFLCNKSDLKDDIELDEELLQTFVDKYNTKYFYTSAKTGDNVEKAFNVLARLVTEDIE